MHFRLIFTNHEQNGIWVEDYLLLARLLLEAAGHHVTYEDKLYLGGTCHVLMENFDEREIQLLRSLKEGGSEFIIIASEYITNGTFNDFQDDYREVVPGNYYGTKPIWQERYRHFVSIAPLARAIWCGMNDPDQLALFRKIAGDVPVLPLPFPHFPEFPRLVHTEPRDIDLFFTGTYTPHRLAIIGQLEKSFRMFHRTPDLPDYLRRHFLARSEIALGLKQGPRWAYPSPMRFWHLLNHGSLVVNERGTQASPLDPFVEAATTDELPAVCHDLIASGEWRVRAAHAYERFAAEAQARPAAEALLDLSFGSRPSSG